MSEGGDITYRTHFPILRRRAARSTTSRLLAVIASFSLSLSLSFSFSFSFSFSLSFSFSFHSSEKCVRNRDARIDRTHTGGGAAAVPVAHALAAIWAAKALLNVIYGSMLWDRAFIP